jgi:uncharacterized protein (DUF2267 family)
MGAPQEYQRATDEFFRLLVDARDIAGLETTNQSYTMVQGVFQVFRRRVSVREAIAFCQALPAVARALFVRDWDIDEPRRPFSDLSQMNQEVQQLRPLHNFAPENSISCVAAALRKNVDEKLFDEALAQLPDDARRFWTP